MARKYIYVNDRDHRETVIFLDDVVFLDHVEQEDKINLKLKEHIMCTIECLSDEEHSDMIADDVFADIVKFIHDERDSLVYSSRYCIINLR